MGVLVNLILAAGMLVVLPLGLRLIDGPGVPAVRAWWPAAALPAAASLWLPRGPLAAALTVPYAVLAVALAGCAAARLARHRSLAPREVAVLTALVTPVVAASALVAERGGVRLLGFDLEILTLTVAHFHYAGFAAALVAGLLCRAVGDRGLARLAALAVPAGTALVGAGYFVNDAVELAGAVVLTVGMWLVAWVTWREIRGRSGDAVTRALLAVASVVLVATMVLALSWAAGELAGTPRPSLAWMAATHGLANAAGFALCALVAWHRLRVRPL